MRFAFLTLTVLAACGGPSPTPTGALCPPGSTLTYQNFGKPFMEEYCTRCHSSTLVGDARHGAPVFHDFDTLVGILNVGSHVDEEAAAGPDAINTLMPDDNEAAPTEAERFQLGEWLACEVGRIGQPDARLSLPDAEMPDAALQ